MVRPRFYSCRGPSECGATSSLKTRTRTRTRTRTLVLPSPRFAQHPQRSSECQAVRRGTSWIGSAKRHVMGRQSRRCKGPCMCSCRVRQAVLAAVRASCAWHSTGSGKTCMSCVYSVLLARSTTFSIPIDALSVFSANPFSSCIHI